MTSRPPICDPSSFHAEARYQRVCAACGQARPFHAHHVVYEQELRRTLGLPKRHPGLYDTRGALRLCCVMDANCHLRHHHGIRVVRTEKLTDDNIAYAFEVLGLYGADYLRAKYDDGLHDSRIMKAELEAA